MPMKTRQTGQVASDAERDACSTCEAERCARERELDLFIDELFRDEQRRLAQQWHPLLPTSLTWGDLSEVDEWKPIYPWGNDDLPRGKVRIGRIVAVVDTDADYDRWRYLFLKEFPTIEEAKAYF